MNGFWIYFIVAWMLVHRSTGGTYRLKGKPVATEGALVFLMLAICFAFVGMAAEVSEMVRLLSVGTVWLAILLLRNAKPRGGGVESIDEVWVRMQKDREETVRQLEEKTAKPLAPPTGRRELHEARGDLERRDGAKIPHRHAGGHEINTGTLAPAEYQQYRTEVESSRAGAHHDVLSPATPPQYRSQQAEVQEVVTEVLQQQAVPSPEEEIREQVELQLQAEQDRYEAEVAAAEARHEAELAAAGIRPSELVARDSDEAAGEPRQAAAEPVQDPGPASNLWQPPAFESRATQVASRTPQQRPESMFSSSGPSNLGSGVTSLFGRPASARELNEADPGRAAVDAEVQEVLENNQLLVDDELTKPDSLDGLSKEKAGRFRYQPTDGIKSRF